MASSHRIFIAFAIEDEWARTYLVGQAKNENSTFSFTDMSVKKPWDEEWKKQCRSRIKGCDGVIALVSKNTAAATGELWEIKTAKEEGIPIIGIYTKSDDKPASLPAELSGVSVKNWTWPNISAFLATL
jgi:nucleoside 2-deoxyribosyltransferase